MAKKIGLDSKGRSAKLTLAAPAAPVPTPRAKKSGTPARKPRAKKSGAA